MSSREIRVNPRPFLEAAEEGDEVVITSRGQLGRTYLFFVAAHGDGRAAGGAQVAHPLNLATGGPHPAPARDLDDRHGRGARPVEGTREAVEDWLYWSKKGCRI